MTELTLELTVLRNRDHKKTVKYTVTNYKLYTCIRYKKNQYKLHSWLQKLFTVQASIIEMGKEFQSRMVLGK